MWGEIAHLRIWAKLHCRLLAPYHKGTRRVSKAPARAQPYATYVQIGTMTVQQKLIANDNTFILAGKGGKGEGGGVGYLGARMRAAHCQCQHQTSDVDETNEP